LRRKPHVASAERHLAVGKLQKLQDFFGAAGHALMFGERLLRRRDRHHFDLEKLMLANHPARVAPGGPGLGAKTIGAGGEAERELRFVENGVADEVC